LPRRKDVLPPRPRNYGGARDAENPCRRTAQAVKGPLLQASSLLCLAKALQHVVNHLPGSNDSLGVTVGDGDLKSLLDSHYEFNGIEPHRSP
jgi:hypothetical protein